MYAHEKAAKTENGINLWRAQRPLPSRLEEDRAAVPPSRSEEDLSLFCVNSVHSAPPVGILGGQGGCAHAHIGLAGYAGSADWGGGPNTAGRTKYRRC
jgi:hypothetical protein